MEDPQATLLAQSARIRHLETRVRRLGALALLALLAPLVPLLAAWQEPAPEVLRLRGLVLVDEEGNDRILMGAPLPESATRKSLPRGHGIALVDATGHDRLLLGESTEVEVGGRLVKRERGYSLLLHDAQGDERGGLGTFDSGKAVMVLDRARPDADGIGMMVDEGLDFVGLMLNHKRNEGRYVQGMGLGIQGGTCFFNMDDPEGRRRLSLDLEAGGDPACILYGPGPDDRRDVFAD